MGKNLQTLALKYFSAAELVYTCLSVIIYFFHRSGSAFNIGGWGGKGRERLPEAIRLGALGNEFFQLLKFLSFPIPPIPKVFGLSSPFLLSVLTFILTPMWISCASILSDPIFLLLIISGSDLTSSQLYKYWLFDVYNRVQFFSELAIPKDWRYMDMDQGMDLTAIIVVETVSYPEYEIVWIKSIISSSFSLCLFFLDVVSCL